MLKLIEQQESYVIKHRIKNMKKKRRKVLRDSFKRFNGFFENNLLSGNRNNFQL